MHHLLVPPRVLIQLVPVLTGITTAAVLQTGGSTGSKSTAAVHRQG